MTFPLPTITVTAAMKWHGMHFEELENALTIARTHGCTEIKKVRVGFKGQIQSIEFEEPRTLSRA